MKRHTNRIQTISIAILFVILAGGAVRSAHAADFGRGVIPRRWRAGS